MERAAMMMFPLNWREARINHIALLSLNEFFNDSGMAPDAPNASFLSRIQSFNPGKNPEDEQQVQNMVREFVMSDQEQSQFHEVNHFLYQSLAVGAPVVLIDMPEILLRMKIGSEYTLAELEAVFNRVANKIHRGEAPPCPPMAA